MKLGITFPIYISNIYLLEESITAIKSLVASAERAKDLGTIDDYYILGVTNYLYDAEKNEPKLLATGLGNIALAENTKNCVAKAWNKGIRSLLDAGCDYVLVSNLDIYAHTLMINELVSWAEETIYSSNIILWTAHEEYSLHKLKTTPSYTKYLGKKTNLPPHFSMFMIHKMFQSLLTPKDMDKKWAGRFDEDFEPAYYEDNDMHRRIELAKFDARSTPRARFFHRGSSTITLDNALRERNNTTFMRNKALYIKKHGGLPGEEKYKTAYNK